MSESLINKQDITVSQWLSEHDAFLADLRKGKSIFSLQTAAGCFAGVTRHLIEVAQSRGHDAAALHELLALLHDVRPDSPFASDREKLEAELKVPMRRAFGFATMLQTEVALAKKAAAEVTRNLDVEMEDQRRRFKRERVEMKCRTVPEMFSLWQETTDLLFRTNLGEDARCEELGHLRTITFALSAAAHDRNLPRAALQALHGLLNTLMPREWFRDPQTLELVRASVGRANAEVLDLHSADAKPLTVTLTQVQSEGAATEPTGTAAQPAAPEPEKKGMTLKQANAAREAWMTPLERHVQEARGAALDAQEKRMLERELELLRIKHEEEQRGMKSLEAMNERMRSLREVQEAIIRIADDLHHPEQSAGEHAPVLVAGQLPAMVLVTLLDNGGDMMKVAMKRLSMVRRCDRGNLANLLAPSGDLAKRDLLKSDRQRVTLTTKGRVEAEAQVKLGTPSLGRPTDHDSSR